MFLDKPVLAHDARWQRTCVAENLPLPHPNHNFCNRPLQHCVQANFSMFWRSSVPIRGTRSCGIGALSNLSPHLEQLHMLALSGRLWSHAMSGNISHG